MASELVKAENRQCARDGRRVKLCSAVRCQEARHRGMRRFQPRGEQLQRFLDVGRRQLERNIATILL